MAALKLLDGQSTFDYRNKDHVFAVLSQRLCLDPVIAIPEAIELASRSVAHHMRLITGVAARSGTFYTYSPSEPILVLGSFDVLYHVYSQNILPGALNTLSKHLCSAGLVEKGVMGELGARILLLIARDFAAPSEPCSANPKKIRRHPLKPVPLLDFIYKLFDKNIFTDTIQEKMFEDAFGGAYVNFTHWILTRDPIPEIEDT